MKSSSEKEALERLAEQIADGESVTWDASGEVSSELQAKIAQLHALQKITSAYRSNAETFEYEGVAGSSAESTSPKPMFQWGHLSVLEELGRGSYGKTYRALDTKLDRQVALKLWPVSVRSDREREIDAEPFLQEARRLAKIRHPNVLTVHGADLHDGKAGLWADLLAGKNLEQRLTSEGTLGAREVVLIGLDLCRALAAIHRAGLVHGDVKTANVMRENGGAIVLVDFGSGRSLLGSVGSDVLFGSTGTPLVLAPEILRGVTPDRSADLYALGVLLYRLVSGKYPVEAETLEQLQQAHARGQRAPLRDLRPDLPLDFVNLVEKAFSPEPRDRFASAGEMERALSAVLNSTDLVAVPSSEPPADASSPTSGPHGVARPARPIGAILSAAIGLIALIGILGLTFFGGRFSGFLDPSSFDVESTLYRVDLRDGSHPLENGGAVWVGDRLFLEIEASDPLHLYVLNEDESGSLFVLFPVAGLELDNPLPANTRHRLPGKLQGVFQDWRVTSAGGRESILIVASREPLRPFEQELAAIPRVEGVTQLAYELSSGALEQLRGIAKMTPSQRPENEISGGRLATLARDFRAQAESTGNLWIRELGLSNSGHR